MSQCKIRWFLKNLLKKLIFHFKLWLPGPITLLQEVVRQVSNELQVMQSKMYHMNHSLCV